MTRKSMLSSIGIVTAGVAIIITVFLYLQYRELKPDYTRDYFFPGLNAPVAVDIDSFGVAHLRGQSESDVIKAQGFYVAMERLWQMERVRRTGSGRLSEVFGDTTVKIDRLFRWIDLEGLSDRLYQQASLESRQWMEWFAQGVNAYLQTAGDELPLEFQLLQIKPDPWLPQHSILIERVMAWILNISWRSDYLYFVLQQKLDPALMQELLPKRSAYHPMIMQNLQHYEPLLKELYRSHQQLSHFWGIPQTGFGSNNWVISGKLARKGKPLLANDPHLFLTIPPIWIELTLQCPQWEVAGFALPGTPGVVIGRNRYYAWGMTNAMVDDADFFLERVDWKSKSYFQDGKEMPLGVRPIRIRVKNGWQEFTAYHTQGGPVVNSLLPQGDQMPAISLKWSGWEVSDELQTFIRLARGQNWKDFREAISYYWAPAQNFVYADREGNIGYQLGGAIPRRTYSSGLLPVPGYRKRFRWEGYLPYSQLPWLLNPEWGFIVTANNKITDKFYLSEIWEPPFRARRIIQMILQQKTGFEVSQMIQMQMDDENLLARELLPDWLIALRSAKEEGGGELWEKVIEILSNWDFRMSPSAVAPTIFEFWMHRMVEELFRPLVGAEGFDLLTDNVTIYFQLYHRIITKEHSPWYSRHPLGSKQALIRSSLDKALTTLQEVMGPHISDWQWGKIHRLYLKHALGEVWVLSRVFNRGPYPLPGSVFTVNVAGHRYQEPFSVVLGPSMRFVVDWSQPEGYFSMLPGGNSGNPFSRFYDNRLMDWVRGRVRQINLSRTRKAVYAFNIRPAK